jgi:uncharacterized protein DUF3327
VENVPKNDRDVDVTFLWRALYDTRNVLVTWCPRSEDCYMSHLGGTDVWFKTLRLRRGSRLPYLISPNDRPDDRWATQPAGSATGSHDFGSRDPTTSERRIAFESPERGLAGKPFY